MSCSLRGSRSIRTLSAQPFKTHGPAHRPPGRAFPGSVRSCSAFRAAPTWRHDGPATKNREGG